MKRRRESIEHSSKRVRISHLPKIQRLQTLSNNSSLTMASYLPQSAHPQEMLFKSHEDSKYLGDEMEYTYGDNKQRMTTKSEDARILLRNLPVHLIPVVKKFLSGQSVVNLNTQLIGIGELIIYV